MGEPIKLTTKRSGVVLRQFTELDANKLFQLIDRNRGHLSKYDDVTSEKYLDFDSVLTSIRYPANPNRLRFGIWVNDTLVGTVNITRKNAESSDSEIGYWVGKEFCGNGYATLATEAIIEFAFTVKDVNYVDAWVHKDNIGSQKVLERALMERVASDEDGFTYDLHRTTN